MDLVDIPRVERLLQRHGDRAARRLFTAAEVWYASQRAEPARHLAARVAAKEAAFKALAGTERARCIGWHDLEVTVGGDRIPRLSLHGLALDRARQLDVASIWLSLTHSDATAAAVVILERG